MNLSSDLNLHIKCKQHRVASLSQTVQGIYIKIFSMTGEKKQWLAKLSFRMLISSITLHQYFFCLQPSFNADGSSMGKDSKLKIPFLCICRKVNASSKHMQDGLGSQWAALEIICFASAKTETSCSRYPLQVHSNISMSKLN